MSLEESIQKSRSAQPVPHDKFDSHMRKARLQDMESRGQIFCEQTEAECLREEVVNNLYPSLY